MSNAPTIFTYIRSQVPILDVVKEYVTLKKGGLYWKSRCPFHDEKTASFTISPHREIFYCFGCHVSGDSIAFIAKIENCSQIEAAQQIIERFGINLPDTLSMTPAADKEKEKVYYEVCKHIALWCHAQAKKSSEAMQYLYKRGCSDDNISRFLIGYFPGGLRAIQILLKDMQKENLLPHDVLQSNVVQEGKSVLYSPFEDRIIFPIKDQLGRFCGFGGRIFKEEDTRPKYYNSRENEYFSKGSLLFGLDIAKKAIQEKGMVFLVEGYTDCIAMVHYGYHNTVATLGTACTLAHLKQVARYAHTLYIVYDADNAGVQAVLRIVHMCWQTNMELFVVTLPNKQDPASLQTQGQDIRPYMNNARDIFTFFVDQLSSKGSETLSHKVDIVQKILQVIKTISEPLKQELLLQKTAQNFQISYKALKQALYKIPRPQATPIQNQPSDPESAHVSEISSYSMLEKKLFCAIINNISWCTKKNVSYIIDYLPGPLKTVLEQLRTMYQTNADLNFITFFDALADHERQYVSALLLEQEEQVDDASFDQLLVQFQKKQWKSIVRVIQKQLANAQREGNTEKVDKIVHDFMTLKEKLLT
jgi:DNA primase